jgi:cytochrome c
MRRFAAMTLKDRWVMSGLAFRRCSPPFFGAKPMDYRIMGSVLGAVLFVVAVHIASQAIYVAPPPAKPAYAVPSVEAKAQAPAAAAPAPAAEPASDFASAIPKADIMAGEAIAERCGACHDWSKGGPNKIGPNLYGVVGRPKASHPGFDYSPALKAKGGNWTYDDLFNFVRQPAAFVPGTKMTFGGLPRIQDRMNLIAFLRMQADSPAPLP